MCQVCEELKTESPAVRPIPIDEAIRNENVFAERVGEKVNEILTKYHCLLQPTLVYADGVTEEQKKLIHTYIKGILVNVRLNNHITLGEIKPE